MARPAIVVAIIVTGLASAAPRASAQYNPYSPFTNGGAGNRMMYNPYSGPTLSPYLNMLRGGNPAANYYMGVVPDRYQRTFDAQIRNNLFQLDSRAALSADLLDEGLLPLRVTGHPAFFLNYSPYYNIGVGNRYNPSNMAAQQRGGAATAAPRTR